jgi:hypothetical protein
VRKFLFWSIVLISAFVAQPVRAQGTNGRFKLLKASWEFDKRVMLTELMQFNDKEADGFWPVYNNYMKDWSKLMNYRIYAIQKYCDDFTVLSGPQSSQFMTMLFENDAALTKLQKKTYKKVKKILSPMRASEFMHIEYGLQLILMSEMQQKALFVGDMTKKL